CRKRSIAPGGDALAASVLRRGLLADLDLLDSGRAGGARHDSATGPGDRSADPWWTWPDAGSDPGQCLSGWFSGRTRALWPTEALACRFQVVRRCHSRLVTARSDAGADASRARWQCAGGRVPGTTPHL